MSQPDIAAFFAPDWTVSARAASHAETAGALYGGEPADAVTARHAERLAIYGRFCALHRLERLGSLKQPGRGSAARVGPRWQRSGANGLVASRRALLCGASHAPPRSARTVRVLPRVLAATFGRRAGSSAAVYRRAGRL